MRHNLLTMVQDMLSTIEAENVSGLAGSEATVESDMCVQIANRGFEMMITKLRWKHTRNIARLEAAAELNELKLNTGVIAFDPDHVWYGTRKVNYMLPEDFLSRVQSRVVDGVSFVEMGEIVVQVGFEPQYYTSFDDETLIFDSIPDDINGLDATETRVLTYSIPTSRLTDDGDVFDLPAVAYPALEMWCIGTAISELAFNDGKASKPLGEHAKAMASLSRNSRVVDRNNDLRKWIVPRPSRYMSNSCRRLN